MPERSSKDYSSDKVRLNKLKAKCVRGQKNGDKGVVAYVVSHEHEHEEEREECRDSIED